MTALPKVIPVEEFAAHFGLSKHQGYEAVQQLPPGVVVRLGRRIRINVEALKDWLSKGGSLTNQALTTSSPSAGKPAR